MIVPYMSQSDIPPVYPPTGKTDPLKGRPIRVLIADDIAMYRGELRRLCEGERDLEVVAEASDGLQAVQLAQELKPDIVLMDLDIPFLDCAEATRRILISTPKAGVIILTLERRNEAIIAALQAGARAHFPKTIAAANLTEAIRGVFYGQVQIDSQITALVVNALREAGKDNPS